MEYGIKIDPCLQMAGPMSLEEIIIHKIQTDGPVSFRDFMEMALYYPGSGYYSSDGEKIGKDGDFCTSPCYTSIFGQMIARQLEEMWHELDDQPFTIVEYGAGTGILCKDILDQLQFNSKLYDDLNYCIIEKSHAMREKAKRIINNKVSWYDSILDIPSFTGCILSNELIDNFAVHQVVMQDELMEVFVGYEKGFIELLKPASPALKSYLAQLNVVLPKGFRTEINLQAIQWIDEIAATMKKGFVLTIDYGYSSAGLYQESRSQGTLVCYHKHKVNYCPYDNIGYQDITTHVNFSALHHWGAKKGLELGGFTNQAHFLLGLGLAMCVETKKVAGEATQFLHTFLYDMGRKLKVLIQQKGVSQSRLSGLKFGQRFV